MPEQLDLLAPRAPAPRPAEVPGAIAAAPWSPPASGWTRELGEATRADVRQLLEEPRVELAPGEVTLLRMALEQLDAAPERELAIGLRCICTSRIALWKNNGQSSRNA